MVPPAPMPSKAKTVATLAPTDPMAGPVGALLRRAGHVTGISVLRDHEIVWSHVAGAPPDRLFQAGSVSKCVAACVALELVHRGAVEIDAHVNDTMRSWELPGTRTVTLRQLLSHTAGVNVPFFPGYDQAAALPSLSQVLEGEPPANTPAVRSDEGRIGDFSYSGGGFAIVQQLIADVTGTGFAEAARELVLGPLEMSASSFDEPLAASARPRAARGDWHVYPEAAAAGLWTTPDDLARFVSALQSAATGRPSALSQMVARDMLTPAVELPLKGEWNFFPLLGLWPPDSMGMGMFLHGRARFSHVGGASNFCSMITGSLVDGSGGAVMTAGNTSPYPFRLLRAAARQFGWSGVALPLWRRPTGLPGLRRFRSSHGP